MPSFTKTFELANRLAIKRGQDYSPIRSPLLSKEQMIQALEGIKDSTKDDLANVQVNIARKEAEYRQLPASPDSREQIYNDVRNYRVLERFIPTHYVPWLEDLIADLQTESEPAGIDPEFVVPNNPVTRARQDLAKIIYELRTIDSQAGRQNVRVLFHSLTSVQELYRLALIQENGLARAHVAPAVEQEPNEEIEPYKSQWNYEQEEAPEIEPEPFSQPPTLRDTGE